jgi:hypothetical protein
MRLKGSLIPVNLEEIIDILILLVAKNIEAQAAWLISFGAESIQFDGLKETLALLRLDLNLHP